MHRSVREQAAGQAEHPILLPAGRRDGRASFPAAAVPADLHLCPSLHGDLPAAGGAPVSGGASLGRPALEPGAVSAHRP
ncbi:hypothetical protein ABZP36_005342 [Zizania latifolia]